LAAAAGNDVALVESFHDLLEAHLATFCGLDGFINHPLDFHVDVRDRIASNLLGVNLAWFQLTLNAFGVYAFFDRFYNLGANPRLRASSL
jgi:hypothetical protein